MRTITSFGFTSRRASQPTPHRSRVPVRKFSTSTSDLATSCFRRSAPAGLRRSRVIRFLVPRLLEPDEAVAGVARARGSRSGAGGRRPPAARFLMTSAPNSASRVPQNGAARNVATSRTRTPSIGRGAPRLSSLACMSYQSPAPNLLSRTRRAAHAVPRGDAPAPRSPALHHACHARPRLPHPPGAPAAPALPVIRSAFRRHGLLSIPMPVISMSTRSPGAGPVTSPRCPSTRRRQDTG